jgi:hypothetical protein
MTPRPPNLEPKYPRVLPS